MKIISLWEPWATLMAIDAKRIETRSWSTSYRGWLAIHAAKKWTKDQQAYAKSDGFRKALDAAGVTKFPLGCIVGVVRLLECKRIVDKKQPWILQHMEPPSEPELWFGNYEVGRFGWVTDKAFRLPEPIPFRGLQGLKDLDEAIAHRISEAWVSANQIGVGS